MEPLKLLIFRVDKWHPFAGEATEGPLKGRQLRPSGIHHYELEELAKNIRIPMWCWVQKLCGSGFWSILWCQHGACMHPVFGKVPIWRISAFPLIPWYLDSCLSLAVRR